jgi:hypothetical protein
MNHRLSTTKTKVCTSGEDLTKSGDRNVLECVDENNVSNVMRGNTHEGGGTFTEVDGNINSQKYINTLDTHLWPVIPRYFPIQNSKITKCET